MREDIFTIIAAIPLPTVIIGVDERLVNANEAAEEIFGAVMKGRHFATYFRNPQLLDAIEGCLFTKSETTAEIVINLRGAERQMKVFLRPFNAHDQSAVMLCFEDHTSLHEVGLFRRDFVANVSHELRTPLTALMGFIETLRGPARNDPAARDRFLQIMADEAKDLHLVSKVVPHDQLMAETMKVAKKISKMSLPSVASAKKAVRYAYESSLTQGNEYETAMFNSLSGTQDAVEGVAAFLSKRKPKWQHK